MSIEDALQRAAEDTAAAEAAEAEAVMSEALLRAKLANKTAGSTDEALIALEVRRLKTRAQAARLYRQETEGPPTPLDVTDGTELAARALDAQPWRVEGLMPSEGSTLITAQRKVGKTTLVMNLARALVTGEEFLGCFPVRPVTGQVGVLNFEVSGPQLGRWAAEAGVPLHRLVVANLRGRRNPLAHDEDRRELAGLLRARGVEVLICDPFANAFDGDNQNDAQQVARFLRELSTFTRSEVGATDLVLANHAGWNADRTRGSSALEDWADSLVLLTSDRREVRYLSANGRDVNVPEGMLTYDEDTRRLTLDRSGNRVMAEHGRRATEMVEAVVEVVREQPGIGTRDLQDELRARGLKFGKNGIKPAIDAAVSTGRVERRIDGAKRPLYPLAVPRDTTEQAVTSSSPGVPRDSGTLTAERGPVTSLSPLQTASDKGVPFVPSGSGTAARSVPRENGTLPFSAPSAGVSVPPTQTASDKGVPSVPQCPADPAGHVPSVPPL